MKRWITLMIGLFVLLFAFIFLFIQCTHKQPAPKAQTPVVQEPTPTPTQPVDKPKKPEPLPEPQPTKPVPKPKPKPKPVPKPISPLNATLCKSNVQEFLNSIYTLAKQGKTLTSTTHHLNGPMSAITWPDPESYHDMSIFYPDRGVGFRTDDHPVYSGQILDIRQVIPTCPFKVTETDIINALSLIIPTPPEIDHSAGHTYITFRIPDAPDHRLTFWLPINTTDGQYYLAEYHLSQDY